MILRKFFLLLVCFTLCTSAIFADDELPDDSIAIQDQQTSGTPVVVDITQLLNQQQQKTNDDSSEDPQEVVVIEPELVSVTSSQQRISSSDTTGFKAVMLSLLGDYETTITDYEYRTGSSNYTSHSISIERDWSWICSCGVFALLLYCTFRSIGGICARF